MVAAIVDGGITVSTSDLPRTQYRYVEAMDAFGKWLVKSGRAVAYRSHACRSKLCVLFDRSNPEVRPTSLRKCGVRFHSVRNLVFVEFLAFWLMT